MWYVICIALAVCGMAAVHTYDMRREQKQWERLREQLEEARNGKIRRAVTDESSLSAVENSLRLFLEDSALAEENNRAQKERIQTLISDISHQTVTPISNVLLYSQLLEETCRDKEQENYASAIREQTEKLEFLIDSLVKISRLENGIITTKPKAASVAELLCDIVSQAEQKAADKGVILKLEQGCENITAHFDPKWTREAVYNIVDNAVKYTPEGGQIRIRAVPYPMFVRIDVEDTGAGMEEEELPKIFRRFYRCGRTNQEPGVGLGLYLTREIIRQEKGYLKVKSVIGKGTVFSVFLPGGNVTEL